MKDYIVPIALFLLLLVFLPFLLAGKRQNVKNVIQTYSSAAPSMNAPLKILLKTDSERAQSVNGFDFVCGVVAGEMSTNFHTEALKAQAVAAFSYCCYQRERADGPAVLTAGLNVAYFPKEDAQKKWGANFNARWGKIEDAVRAVYGKAIFYEGKVIDATYYSMSSGITENCKDVFGSNLPYLTEVPSPGDKLQKNYETHVTVTLADFKTKVTAADPNAKFSGDPGKYLTVLTRSGAGGVMRATLCGKETTGAEVRKIFSLRSANFTVSYANSTYSFDVKGYGHGVGMSQYGAEYMAGNGSGYADILKWYYKGTTIGDYPDADALTVQITSGG